jgi:hypothetical protein
MTSHPKKQDLNPQSRMRELAVIVLALTALGFSPSCKQMAANNRIETYTEMLAPMVGVATMDDIVLQFGAPVDQQELGTLEVWTYHQSFGTRGGAFISPYNQGGQFASGQSYEVYDRLTFTFEASGVLHSYRVYVQR